MSTENANSTNKGTRYMLNMVSILLIYTFASAGSLMSAAVQSYMDAWPEVSMTTIMMVNTLPALASMPMMLIVGAVVGTKMSYKTASIIGSVLVVAGGVLPCVYAPSWTFVLVCRFIIGIGAGFYGMRTALLIKSCRPEDQAKYIGLGQTLYSVGSMVISPVVGVLVNYSWRYSFLVDLFPIVIIVMCVLFMQEPEKEETAASDTAAVTEKVQLDKRIILYWLLQFVSTGVVYPLLSCMTIFFNDFQLGNAATAGMVLSAYTLGCALAGLLVVPLQNVFKRKTITAAYLLTAVGQAVVLFVPSVPTAFAGAFITGIGFMLSFTCLSVYLGKISHPSNVTFATTLLMLFNQVGIFVSSYFILFGHAIFHRPTTSESAFMLNLVCQIVMAGITLIGSVVPRD